MRPPGVAFLAAGQLGPAAPPKFRDHFWIDLWLSYCTMRVM